MMAVELVQKNMFQLFGRISTYLKVFSLLALLILYHIYLGMKSYFCKLFLYVSICCIRFANSSDLRICVSICVSIHSIRNSSSDLRI